MESEERIGQGDVCWVSPRWLMERAGNTELRIIDTQPNIHDYFGEHIPEAVFMDEGLLRIVKKGIPGFFVPPGVIEQIFGRLGIRAEVPVVVYSCLGAFSKHGNGLEQTMVAYSLARFGHRRVHILDGGLERWKTEGGPLTRKYPRIEDTRFPVTERSDYFIEYEEFRAKKDDPDTLVLDARSREWYEGTGVWEKSGHIPGAKNLPWDFLTDESNHRRLKPVSELRSILDSLGAFRAKNIYCYCGTGREATILFLVLRMVLGHPGVRVYEGAFTEWSAYPENPTVTGPHPR